MQHGEFGEANSAFSPVGREAYLQSKGPVYYSLKVICSDRDGFPASFLNLELSKNYLIAQSSI